MQLFLSQKSPLQGVSKSVCIKFVLYCVAFYYKGFQCSQLQLQLFLLNTRMNILQCMTDLQVALANLGGSACGKIYDV